MNNSEASLDDDSYSGNESRMNIFTEHIPMIKELDKDLGDFLNPYAFGCQTKPTESDTFGVQTNSHDRNVNSAIKLEPTYVEEKDCSQCVGAVEPYCHVKLNSLMKLKESTRKLLSLIEEIELNTISKQNENQPSSSMQQVSSVYHSSVQNLSSSFTRPDNRPRSLISIECESEPDDCSVYKRLTRKCHCLNQLEYNDFIIHFNESTKYFTSSIGEIIKNLRIVKKFVYIGGDYTKHALMFLNEGLTYSTHQEKLDIIQGCAHADICNVFDDQSIVTVCISLPCNDKARGDSITQSLAATFLNKLAQTEEGRKYLKFSSKITNDLKKVIRKKSSKLEYEILYSINDTLNLMQPPLAQQTKVSYYCKPTNEGFGGKTVNTLLQYRNYMSIVEVYTHLDLLNNLSDNESGKMELFSFFPTLMKLFKCMLVEFDDSEMNIIITNIINNIVTRSMIKARGYCKHVVVAETATEPILMKNQTNQIPLQKTVKKKIRSKLRITSPIRFKQALKIRNPKYSVIVVPVIK